MTRFQGRDADVAWKDDQLAIQRITDMKNSDGR